MDNGSKTSFVVLVAQKNQYQVNQDQNIAPLYSISLYAMSQAMEMKTRMSVSNRFFKMEKRTDDIYITLNSMKYIDVITGSGLYFVFGLVASIVLGSQGTWS